MKQQTPNYPLFLLLFALVNVSACAMGPYQRYGGGTLGTGVGANYSTGGTVDTGVSYFTLQGTLKDATHSLGNVQIDVSTPRDSTTFSTKADGSFSAPLVGASGETLRFRVTLKNGRTLEFKQVLPKQSFNTARCRLRSSGNTSLKGSNCSFSP